MANAINIPPVGVTSTVLSQENQSTPTVEESSYGLSFMMRQRYVEVFCNRQYSTSRKSPNDAFTLLSSRNNLISSVMFTASLSLNCEGCRRNAATAGPLRWACT